MFVGKPLSTVELRFDEAQQAGPMMKHDALPLSSNPALHVKVVA